MFSTAEFGESEGQVSLYAAAVEVRNCACVLDRINGRDFSREDRAGDL